LLVQHGKLLSKEEWQGKAALCGWLAAISAHERSCRRRPARALFEITPAVAAALAGRLENLLLAPPQKSGQTSYFRYFINSVMS